MWTECPSCSIDLDAPKEERFQKLPSELIEHSRNLIYALSDVLESSVPGAFPYDEAATLIKQATKGHFDQEAEEVALAHSVEADRVLCTQAIYDIALAMGCATIVLPTSSGPIMARNMDWPPEDKIALASCLMHYQRGGKTKFTNAGFTSGIGAVTGMSANGFALAVNAVSGDLDQQGFPMLLFLRFVLENAEGFDQALDWLTRQRLAMSGMITLVGTKNEQRVVIERETADRTRDRCSAKLRFAEADKPLITTNHFRAFEATEDDRACSRYARLEEILKTPPSTDADSLLSILNDIQVKQDITAQQVIAQPATGLIRMFFPNAALESGWRWMEG
jgi:hypothetical protein